MRLLLALVAALGGLHGIVSRGPIQPVCRVGVPCTKPAPGATLLFSRDGRVAARVRTGAGGRYSVRLRPGLYSVRVEPPPTIGGRLSPAQVRVTGAFAHVDFLIDTGIR